MIKINDLAQEFHLIEKDFRTKLNAKFSGSEYILGSSCENFEKNYSNISNIKHTIACANGSDAIQISVRALGLQGRKVVVPCESWIATASMVALAGCDIIFCDTDENGLIDLQLLDELLAENHDVAGVIVVHLYGKVVDLDKLLAIKDKYEVKIIEDCAQAHLGRFNNRSVGSVGDLATFSFYPGKNLGAIGDAGAICSNSLELSNKARRIARHGCDVRGYALELGFNSRMDEIQALVLIEKLNIIHYLTEKRINNAKVILENVLNDHVTLPLMEDEKFSHVFHQFVVKTNDRAALISHLKKYEIETNVHYRYTLDQMPAFAHSVIHPKKDETTSRKNVKTVLSLPCHPFLSSEDLEKIIEALNAY
jgi:dTDP-4-amino-4,6-dideoxygalactose transaminase